MKKIAIVGSGISGLSAAWALHEFADVTLFEADDRIGGHAHTVSIRHGGEDISVDVGFIVCNPLNYPNFMPFLETLGVETVKSDMSFAVSDPNGFEWSSNPKGIFAQKQNFFRPSFWKLLIDIVRFNAQARKDADAGTIPDDETLGAYLSRLGMNQRFLENYILPMGAAIWSTPEADMLNYPARSFLTFFNNHRLLHAERPTWRTVSGGSQSYVHRIADLLGDRVRTSTSVLRIDRTANSVALHTHSGTEMFDEVILACHAPQAQRLLGKGFDQQAEILAPVQTVLNKAYLHADDSLMPKTLNAWAAWNVLKGQQRHVSLSYWMNILQNIDPAKPVFVTLNPEQPPAAELTFGSYDFEHPLFNTASQNAVTALHAINGQDNVWFAGAWMGHGFHEDGLKAGLSVATALGAELPWQSVGLQTYAKRPAYEPISLADQVAAQ